MHFSGMKVSNAVSLAFSWPCSAQLEVLGFPCIAKQKLQAMSICVIWTQGNVNISYSHIFPKLCLSHCVSGDSPRSNTFRAAVAKATCHTHILNGYCFKSWLLHCQSNSANAPGKASNGRQPRCFGRPRRPWFLASAWPSPNCYNHQESEPAH